MCLDRLNIESVGSSDHIITTSLYHQGHSVGSSATRNNIIERSIGPIDVIDISDCFRVIAIVVSHDSCNSTSHIRNKSLCQDWCSARDSSKHFIGHHLRSHNRSDHVGIHRILTLRNGYRIIPSFSRRNQGRDDVLLVCNRIYIFCTIARVIINSLLVNCSSQDCQVQVWFDTIATERRLDDILFVISSTDSNSTSLIGNTINRPVVRII